jgi:hypothetical protein
MGDVANPAHLKTLQMQNAEWGIISNAEWGMWNAESGGKHNGECGLRSGGEIQTTATPAWQAFSRSLRSPVASPMPF